MAGENFGFQVQLGMDPGGSVTTGSERYYIDSEALKIAKPILSEDGTSGSRFDYAERTRQGPQTVGGPINLKASPTTLTNLLPRILGAVASGSTFAVAETLPAFTVMIDRGAKVYQYTGCMVNKATFKSAARQLVDLVLDIMALDRSIGASGSFPSIALPTDAPYQFADGVLTLLGVARKMYDFELEINNNVQRIQANELVPSSLRATATEITFKTTNPFNSDNTDLPDQDPGGFAGSLVLTNGANSCSISLPKLIVPALDPVMTARNAKLGLPLEMMAKKTASTAPIVFTNS